MEGITLKVNIESIQKCALSFSFNNIQVIAFSHVFTLCLDILEDAGFSFASLALVLAGHLTSLASSVRFYKSLSALLSKLVTTDSLLDILAELEEELVMLACHRFGYTVVVALLEAELPPATRERLVGKFQGRIAELACHPICCAWWRCFSPSPGRSSRRR